MADTESDGETALLEEDFERFKERQEELNELHDSVLRSRKRLYEKQDLAARSFASQQKEYARLKRTLKQLPKTDFVSKVSADLEGIKDELEGNKDIFPKSGSLFARMYLSDLNLRITKTNERLSFKRDYEMFKSHFSKVFCSYYALLLFIDYLDPTFAPDNATVTDTLLQSVRMFYYVALALRENILVVNGSRITRWWLLHHYLMMLVSLLMLTWPATQLYFEYRPAFLWMSLYAGCTQLLQTRYQVARLYALRALNKADIMDTPNSETAQIHWSEQMVFLLPFLWVGQAWQLYNAYVLYHMSLDPTAPWQIAILALLWLVTGGCNLFTTLKTIARSFRKQKSS